VDDVHDQLRREAAAQEVLDERHAARALVQMARAMAPWL
jgi:hypothetical protein